MTNRWNRRTLLRNGLVASGGLATFGGLTPFTRLARGSGPDGPDLYYVFAYFSGGWDVLLGLDPRDPAQFNEENLRDTRIQPAYALLEGSDGQLIRAGNLTFGPYIGDLAAHASKLAVVRGMSMETLTHEAGRRRFLTGKTPSGLLARGSSASTLLAAKLGQSQPIPNLAIQVESYNADQPSYASGLRASGVDDLVRALRPTDPALSTSTRQQLDHLLETVARCDLAQASPTWTTAEASRQKSREMVNGQLDAMFDFSANTPQMERLRDHFGIESRNLRSAEAQAAMAAQAIKGGISRAVSIQVAGGLDTHFDEWTTDQGPNQMRGFNVIARLIEELESSPYRDTGESWMDHTVIVGFSEFSRTPLLNARGGRDHALMNACFLTGAGIKGGTAVGRSSDLGMAPMPIDLATGQVSMGGEIPKPEHIIQTLLHNAGFTDDFADLRVGPIPALCR